MYTIPDSHTDIVEKSQIVTLATINRDGSPHVSAMWFLLDDGQVRLSLNTSRQKARNILRDPRVSAFFVDPENPYRTIEIRGSARVEPDPEYAFADRVGAKYGGVDLRNMDQPGESRIVVTIDPDKILTFGE